MGKKNTEIKTNLDLIEVEVGGDSVTTSGVISSVSEIQTEWAGVIGNYVREAADAVTKDLAKVYNDRITKFAKQLSKSQSLGAEVSSPEEWDADQRDVIFPAVSAFISKKAEDKLKAFAEANELKYKDVKRAFETSLETAYVKDALTIFREELKAIAVEHKNRDVKIALIAAIPTLTFTDVANAKKLEMPEGGGGEIKLKEVKPEDKPEVKYPEYLSVETFVDDLRMHPMRVEGQYTDNPVLIIGGRGIKYTFHLDKIKSIKDLSDDLLPKDDYTAMAVQYIMSFRVLYDIAA